MAEKILIIGPSWIGDAVMAQSLFKLLQLHGDPSIHVLAPAWTFSILNCMPEISQAIAMPIEHGQLQLRARFTLGKELRQAKYDRAIVLPNSFKSALIPWWAKIPKRTGYLGEGRFGLLNDMRYLDKKRYPLMVEQYLALGIPKHAPLPKPYPYPQFVVTPASQQQTLAHIKPLYRGKPILGMAPGGAFGPSKRWPAEYFAAVANAKIKEGWDIWLFGSKQDHAIVAEIMRLTQQQCADISGKTELSGTIDLVSLTSGILTNDSGLMHIAAALNKPMLVVYGSTSPQFTPPLAENAQILKLNLACQPCFKRTCPLGHHQCMRDLLPEMVITAINQWAI